MSTTDWVDDGDDNGECPHPDIRFDVSFGQGVLADLICTECGEVWYFNEKSQSYRYSEKIPEWMENERIRNSG